MTYDFELITDDFIKRWTRRKILHFDMDCFYAAVEMRDNPQLKKVPLAIGGPANSRSVLCTANYLARKFGVRAAMSSYQAQQQCPQLVILPPDFSKYKKESQRVNKIFQEYTDKIEPLSLDEAFLDVTELVKTQLTATQIAREIKFKVFKETGLTISAGVSFNKFLAKVASDWQKPDGFFVIPPQRRENFMQELPIKFIYGIGKKTLKKLEDLNIHNACDIQNKNFNELKSLFGNRYMDMFYLSHGLDFREVESHWERKSLSTEETFSKDIIDEAELRKKIFHLYKDWQNRFEKHKTTSCIKSHFIKIKYFDFKQTTHETKNSKRPELNDFLNLFNQVRQKKVEAIRLIGIGVRLEEAPKETQLEFFAETNFF